MRLGEWIRTVGSSMPWVVLALAVDPAAAQFREVQLGANSSQAIEIRLTPTRQNFVAPQQTADASSEKAAPPEKIEPVVAGEPTPAANADTGTPTPAEPTQAAATPTAATPTATTPTVATPTVATPTATVAEPVKEVTGPSTVAKDEATPTISEHPAPAPVLRPGQLFSAFRRSTTSAPASDAPTPKLDASPLTFNQVTPGVTTVAEVQAIWGDPAKTTQDEAGKMLIYRAPGFRQVDLVTNADGDIVTSILVHLNEPTDLDQLNEHLALTNLRAVEIADPRGVRLGRGYPERGVLLNYAAADTPTKITHVALEPIHAELYRLRAENEQHERYALSLSDLEQATRLDPQDAKAFWLQSEVLSLAGRTDDAWKAISVASRIEPGNSLYQLTRARLAASSGDLTEAVLFTKNVAQDEATPSVVRARAEYQWGNLLAMGPEPDVQEAMTHHLKAIDLAARHANDQYTDVRRMAKDILVDAHLAIAQDIALGNFQRQRTAVPKWLVRATELAEEFIAGDEGDETMRMEIYRTTLAVYSVLDGNFDASIATEEAIREGQRLVAASQDRMYQFRIERELSEVLYHAAKVEHRCGRLPTALRYVNNAVALLEGDKDNVQPSLFDRVMSGQLYFLIGSIYAMQDEDHTEATKWFDKAIPLFDDERLVHLIDSSAFGDLFVSMGVSYWESGDHDKAIKLTQAGADLMQDGVQTGVIEMAALSVPYGNLTAMHQHMGNGDRAKHFAKMLAKVENDTESIRR